MNKKSKRDLVDEVIRCSKDGDITSYLQAKRMVDTVLKSIVEMTKDGDTMLVISKFGTFMRVTRHPRTFITPRGGEVNKGETQKLSFKSSKQLERYYDELNSAGKN